MKNDDIICTILEPKYDCGIVPYYICNFKYKNEEKTICVDANTWRSIEKRGLFYLKKVWDKLP